eukprot:14769123-Ditylum_brightwellii.AAC.1
MGRQTGGTSTELKVPQGDFPWCHHHMAHGVSTRASACPQVAPPSTFHPSEKRGSMVLRLTHFSEACQKGSMHEGEMEEGWGLGLEEFV